MYAYRSTKQGVDSHSAYGITVSVSLCTRKLTTEGGVYPGSSGRGLADEPAALSGLGTRLATFLDVVALGATAAAFLIAVTPGFEAPTTVRGRV